MKISVLIAAQGNSAGLDKSLASIHAQAHTEWELIVATAGASDAHAAAVQEFGAATGRPALHRPMPAEAAVADVRNQLLEIATGDPVAFLEPGDTWTPRHLSNALHEISTGADLAVSDVRIAEGDDHRLARDISAPAQLFTNPTRTLFARDAIASLSAVVLRRETATRAGGFDNHFRRGEARDFFLRCALLNARFAATHRATCQCAPGTEPETILTLLAAEDAVTFYEKHRDLAAVPSALRRRLLAASLVAHGKLLRDADPARAARCFWRAWSLQPVHVQTLGQFALTGFRTNPSAQNETRRSSNALGNGNS